jgi:predicted nucleic acid-binding protein
MVVLDTSIIFKWFNDTEEKREEAKIFLVNHLNKTEPIVVPDLLLCEISNAWATKTALTSEEVAENITLLSIYALNIVPVTFDLVMKASRYSKTYSISVYDAIYIVLAEEKKIRLVTADEKLCKRVPLRFVSCLR